MDKPKTPEESKFSEDDFKYYTDTIVRIMKNAICKKGSTPNDAIDELNSFFAYAISAERNANLEKKSICDCCKEEAIMICHKCYQVEYIQPLESANLEKIKESDKCIDDLRFELGKQASWCIKLRNTMREAEKLFADELKSLESKLAEEANAHIQTAGTLQMKVERLEAEAKAVRGALILVAVRWSPDLDGYCWCSKNREPSEHKPFCVIAKRSLNNEKGEQHG